MGLADSPHEGPTTLFSTLELSLDQVPHVTRLELVMLGSAFQKQWMAG